MPLDKAHNHIRPSKIITLSLGKMLVGFSTIWQEKKPVTSIIIYFEHKEMSGKVHRLIYTKTYTHSATSCLKYTTLLNWSLLMHVCILIVFWYMHLGLSTCMHTPIFSGVRIQVTKPECVHQKTIKMYIYMRRFQ